MSFTPIGRTLSRRTPLNAAKGDPQTECRKPTVLVYTSNLLPVSETFVKEQLLALRRWRGVLVGLRQLNQLPLDGLDVRTLRQTHESLMVRARWKVCRNLGTVPSPVVDRLAKEHASLIHAHFGVEAVEAWPISKALRLPMLVSLHGYDININRDWWEEGHGGAGQRTYPRRLLELAARPQVHFIAVSDAVRRRAIAYGVPADKISLRHIGVDCKKFAPKGHSISQRARRVLFVGRLVEKKGCEYLINAFAKVQSIVADACLVIVGDGPLRNSLEQLAHRLSLTVEFRGALSSAQVQQEFHLARIFCLPSVTAKNGDAEGFGLVLLEAQASGVPVITSATGGATEGILHGQTGFAVAERDTQSLSTQLVKLLTDDALAEAFASAALIFVNEKFNLVERTEALEDLYAEWHARWPTTD
jgi:glycosyltransferase involved in cell wall biosynthesis